MNKRLVRSEKNRIVAGVCQGLGEYLGIDPLILRILFVVLAMANGTGLVLYVMAWLFIPKGEATFATHEEMVRHNAAEIGQRARELGRQARGGLGRDDEAVDPWSVPVERVVPEERRNSLGIGGIVLVSVGILLLMRNIGLFAWFRPSEMLPLALIGVGAVLLLNNLRKA
jgi:phage shock protein C